MSKLEETMSNLQDAMGNMGDGGGGLFGNCEDNSSEKQGDTYSRSSESSSMPAGDGSNSGSTCSMTISFESPSLKEDSQLGLYSFW